MTVDTHQQSSDGQTSAETLTGELYAAHGRALLAYVRRLTGDRHRGEDLVQETLLRAWLHADGLIRDHATIRGWLFRVAYNVVVDDMRARRCRPAEVFDEAIYRNVGVGDATDRLLTRIEVSEALKRLTPKHRRVLVEVYYCGRTVNEAAEVLRIPHGTAKSRIRLGLQHLNRLLG